MNPEDILDFLKKGKDDQELMLMCQAAMDELGPQGFMDATKPAADDALQWYEDKLDTVEDAYVQMVGTVPRLMEHQLGTWRCRLSHHWGQMQGGEAMWCGPTILLVR